MKHKKPKKLKKPIYENSLYGLLYNHYENRHDELITILHNVVIAGENSHQALIEDLDERIFPGRKDNNTRLEGKNSSTLRTFYMWVAIFHYVYDVPMHVFGLPEEDPVYRYYLERPKNKFSLVHLEDLEKRDLSHHTKKAIRNIYLKPTNDLLNNLRKRLNINDYLERYKFLQESNSENEYEKKNTLYIDIHKTIYKEIEKKVLPEENNIEYIRLLSLPLRYARMQNFDQINSKEFSDDEIELMRKEIIRFTSVSLFEHICNCIKERPDYQELKIGKSFKKRSGFYMVYPFRTASFALIDDCNWFLTEYYKFEHGACRLDMMYVEEAGTQNRDRADVYSKEILNIVNSESPNPKFTIKGSSTLILELIIEQKIQLGIWNNIIDKNTNLENIPEDVTNYILNNKNDHHQIGRLLQKYDLAKQAEDLLLNGNLNA